MAAPPNYIDALAIFNQFYKQEEPAATESAAKDFPEKVLSCPRPEDALCCVQWDLLEFSYKNPQSIE